MKQIGLAIDLDGTIIDSKQAIQEALRYAFWQHNIANDGAINGVKIGPPLIQIIKSVCPDASTSLIRKVSESFMQVYDEKYCLDCSLYPDAKNAMRSLSRTYDLLLVTNKRIRPTETIVKHFGLDSFFSKVIGCDSLGDSYGEKSHVLVYLTENGNMAKGSCWYIGDTVGDALACHKAGVPFVHAKWGYCEEKIASSLVSLAASDWREILSLPLSIPREASNL